MLDPVNGGDVLLYRKTPEEIGYALWRARVSFVAKEPLMFATNGAFRTPNEYFRQIKNFQVHVERETRFADPILIAARWDVEKSLFNTEWHLLTASQNKRISLAIALACRPDVLLLDEPTASLDPSLALLVENTIRSLHFSVVWATRNIFQAERVADTVLIFNTSENSESVDDPDALFHESKDRSSPQPKLDKRISLAPSETHASTLAQKMVASEMETIDELEPEILKPPVKIGTFDRLAATVRAIAVAADIIAEKKEHNATPIVRDQLDILLSDELDDRALRSGIMSSEEQNLIASESKILAELTYDTKLEIDK